MKHFVLTALACFLLLGAKTQTPSFSTSGDIYLGLKKLNVLGSVLYIAAHPDDENTRLLTYFSKEKLYRTGYLSITRGDGGQNLIGDEQGIELGLIRTQELLSARRIDGAEQFFTRAFDFGYSKSPQETFAKWDKEKILSDVVWVIRKFQPDVIITRFPTTGEGGHGHHTASAILALEAFSVAADPKRFPEQLQYVQPWQAKRILWNGFVPGGGNATGNDFFRIDVGGFNPLLGKSYGEIASESRSQHKSQGFGVARGRGEAIENFRTLAGEAPTNDLFDGINTSISKAVNNKSWQEIQKQIDDLNARFDFLAPQKSVPSLVKLYSLLQPQLSANNPWILQKNKEVRDLILACSGLWIEAFTNVPSVTQGDSLQITVVLNNRLGQPITVRKITEATQTDVWYKQLDTILPKNKNFIFSQKVKLLPNSAITQPHWLEQKMTEGYYNVSSQLLIGTPDARPAGTVDVLIKIGEDLIQFGDFPIRYKFTDPVKGELHQPLAILPKIEFNYTNENYFLFDRQAVSVPVQVKSNKNDSTHYQFEHQISKNWTSSLPQFGYSPSVGVDNNAIAKFSPAKNGLNFKEQIFLRATAKSGAVYQNKRNDIRYDHIPWITYFPFVSANLIAIDLKTEGKKIGYITGAGDKVPEALEQMGYEVTMLTNKELARNNLKQFDAIISGVRAYNTNEWLNTYYDKLMKYVEEGGNLIVQYNTSNQIGPVRAKMGPFNFGISRNRITDENATVNFLKPEHPVLNFPNKISADDFTGWVQERSVYHADNWDSRYESILSMNDPGEQPNAGSLIIAKHGKGFFTYTGLVFFRELPAGVPGAYRLLANLIALTKIKGS